ncbi:hypothetical protein LB505_005734 [Fusarium chuoi]|nr:hypothetical protein LB505_005734 [Fusarium chuoi]
MDSKRKANGVAAVDNDDRGSKRRRLTWTSCRNQFRRTSIPRGKCRLLRTNTHAHLIIHDRAETERWRIRELVRA